MDNLAFVDEENIPLVQQDEDYDHYNIPNTRRVDEASFMEPATTEATLTLRLTKEVKRDKLAPLYRHLNLKCNTDLIDLHQFKLTTDTKRRATIFEFYYCDRWVPLTKQTGEFFAPKTLRERFGGIKAMRNFLAIKATPPLLERSTSAAIKLKAELSTDLQMESIPLKDLASLVEDIHVKTREALQNTDLDMREFLGTDSVLQGIQDELLNNTSKLTDIDKRIKIETKNLEEVENGSSYTNEQRQLYIDRLYDLNTEKQARLELLLENRKNLQIQVARIK